MSNKLKTASSLSADSTQIRYQKALKQISKLIGVNTELREEQTQLYESIADLQSKLQVKQEHISKILMQKNNLETQMNSILSEKSHLANQREQLSKELSRLKGICTSTESKLMQKLSNNSNSEGENKNQVIVISELEKLLESKDETIKKVPLFLTQLKKKIYDLEEVSKDFGNGKFMYSEVIKSDLNNNDLNKKLNSANDYINKLGDQCADLRGQLIKLENRNSLISARSLDSFRKYSAKKSPRTCGVVNMEVQMPQNSAEVLKNYHRLQEENKKLNRKNQNFRNENQRIIKQLRKNEEELSKLTNQNTGFNLLITKQQSIIEQMHQKFNQEVIKMTNDFKQKLHTQRESFSPGKMADNVKMIQQLQAENKQLRKKNQLSNIQFTKYFKILEQHKQKIAEYQIAYADRTAQRDQYLQKLNKLQSSYLGEQRDRSNHSRGSASRIVDNDRRNSMGETGHFNHHS